MKTYLLISKNTKTLRNMPQQEGAMLLEALVAMVIFMVGVLGLIGLQTRATQISMEGQLRSSAAYLASQVISEMRLVPATSLAANYATGTASYNLWANIVKNPSIGLPGAVSYPPTIDISTTATGTQRAIVTLQWKSTAETTPHKYVTIAEF